MAAKRRKSGNGLRIFCRYLFDRGLVKLEPFRVHTPGGIVEATVHDQGRSVTVQMGRVSLIRRNTGRGRAAQK